MMKNTWPLVGGVVVVGLAVYIGARSVSVATPDWLKALPADAPAKARELAQKAPAEAEAIRLFLNAKVDDPEGLLTRYGARAPRAFVALGEPGLDMLKYSNEMPNLCFYIDSSLSKSVGAGLHPVADYLAELTRRDPAQADHLFYCFTRMSDRQAQLLEKFPQALPVLAVAPGQASEVIERFGQRAVSFLLRYTPDSYAEVARLLSRDGERLFRVRDALIAANPDLMNARQDLLESLISMYFIEHGDSAAWLESRFGVEKTLFFLSNNMDYLRALKHEQGDVAVRSALMSLVGYAQSTNAEQNHIADLCVGIPGALPLFIDTCATPALRDRFILSYAERGGVGLLALGYPRELWPSLIDAVDKKGESAMVTLSMLVEHKLFKEMLGKILRDPMGHTVAEALQAVTSALAADGGPNAQGFRLVERTLAQILNNHWADIPDDYLSRQVFWLWDVLPGRDAFRLAQMLLHGYSPTLMEQINGVWDAANVVIFVYEAGASAVDCTSAVRDALGKGSFMGLAQALGVVAKEAVGNVMTRLIQSISNPRNYIRLALVSGYFAYDAFLTYAPMEIPNRARLLEINQKFLTPTMKKMVMDLVIEVGLQSLVWRPEFDHKNGAIPMPQAPADMAKLSQQERLVFELSTMDAKIKTAFLKLLDSNDQRRTFLKMLGLANDAAPEEEGDMPAPKAKPFDPLDPKGESEEMSAPRKARSGSLEPVASVVVDGKTVPLYTPKIRNLMPGARTSNVSGHALTIPRDAASWNRLLQNNPEFTKFCLDQIVNLIGR